MPGRVSTMFRAAVRPSLSSSVARAWQRHAMVALHVFLPLSALASQPEAMQLIAPPAGDIPELVGFHPRVHGDWIAVGGSYRDGEASRGSLHLFRRTGNTWTHVQRITSPAPASEGDAFGANVAFAGDWLAVGDIAAQQDGLRSGLVHLYRIRDEHWTLHSTAAPEQPRENGGFGAFVDIDRGTLVVGEAEGLQSGGWGDNRAIHLFALRNGTWQSSGQIAAPPDLKVPDALVERAVKETGMARAAGFGAHFDLDGDRLAVSAMGANTALIYRRRDAAWTLTTRLDDPQEDGGFARTVDFDGDRLLVSALRSAGAVPDSGVAYIYRADDAQWRLEQTLGLPDGKRLDMFGHWVAFDDGTAVIGAFRRREGDDDHASGAAYLFRRERDRWTIVRTLSPPQPASRKFTAYAVDIDGNFAVFSPGDEMHRDIKTLSGAVGGVWIAHLPSAAETQDVPTSGHE